MARSSRRTATGRAVYRVRPERFVALNGWLTELSAYWRGQLDSPGSAPRPGAA